MTTIHVGSDNGPEAQDGLLLCLAARTDGYQPTCGDLDHCPSCQLCDDVHADDCPHGQHPWSPAMSDTTTQQLEKIRAGASLVIMISRGRVAVGPATNVTPDATLRVHDETTGDTYTVRIVRVLGTWSKSGVDYSTAIFTRVNRG